MGVKKLKILDENSVVLPKNKALFCYYDENGNQKSAKGQYLASLTSSFIWYNGIMQGVFRSTYTNFATTSLKNSNKFGFSLDLH